MGQLLGHFQKPHLHHRAVKPPPSYYASIPVGWGLATGGDCRGTGSFVNRDFSSPRARSGISPLTWFFILSITPWIPLRLIAFRFAVSWLRIAVDVEFLSVPAVRPPRAALEVEAAAPTPVPASRFLLSHRCIIPARFCASELLGPWLLLDDDPWPA